MHFLGTYETPFVHGLFLLGTVALSVACYRHIEVPWRRRLRGPTGASGNPATASGEMSTAIPSHPT